MKQWPCPTPRKGWAGFLTWAASNPLEVRTFLKIALNNIWYISGSLRAVKDLRGDIFWLVTQVTNVSTASQMQQDIELDYGQWGARHWPLSVPFLDVSRCDKTSLKFIHCHVSLWFWFCHVGPNGTCSFCIHSRDRQNFGIRYGLDSHHCRLPAGWIFESLYHLFWTALPCW